VLRSLSVVILIAGLLPAADRQVTYQGDIAPLRTDAKITSRIG